LATAVFFAATPRAGAAGRFGAGGLARATLLLRDAPPLGAPERTLVPRAALLFRDEAIDVLLLTGC
jgi:hypothetical protein